MVFTIVQHNEVFPQDFGVRRIDLRILCQQVYLAMGGVVRDFCSRFHYPRETARAQRLYSALVGYAVTSTAMIAHSVKNSQSLLSYRGPEEPMNTEVYKCLRERFPSKQLPGDSVDPVSVHFNMYLKSVRISLSGNYAEIFSSIAAADIDSREKAVEYIRSVSCFDGHDFAEKPKSITSLVGDFNVISAFIEKLGGTLVGLPQRELGSDIIIARHDISGTMVNFFAGSYFADHSAKDLYRYAIYAAAIRRIDGNYIVLSAHCTDDPFTEISSLHLIRVAEVFVGRASTTHWINPDLGIVKVPTDLAAPIMIKGSITYVEGFTAVGELEKTLNSYHFRASKLFARPSLRILSEKSEKCLGYIV